jgi:hypothetical protein
MWIGRFAFSDTHFVNLTDTLSLSRVKDEHSVEHGGYKIEIGIFQVRKIVTDGSSFTFGQLRAHKLAQDGGLSIKKVEKENRHVWQKS